MLWKNSPRRYGAVTKAFHWATCLLVAHQFVTAILMETGIVPRLFDWHQIMGLAALLVFAGRLAWRLATPLPDWAVGLFGWEISIIRTIERLLYLCLFLVGLSGVGLALASGTDLRLGRHLLIPGTGLRLDGLARAATLVHLLASYALVAMFAVHLAFVLRRHLYEKGLYIRRMLPFTCELQERPGRDYSI